VEPWFGWAGRSNSLRLDLGPLVVGEGVSDVLQARRVVPIEDVRSVVWMPQRLGLPVSERGKRWRAVPMCVTEPPRMPWGEHRPRSASITGPSARVLLDLCDERPAPTVVLRTHETRAVHVGVPRTVVRLGPGAAALVLDRPLRDEPLVLHLATIRTLYVQVADGRSPIR